jgi:nucleoid-associated protein EbfC
MGSGFSKMKKQARALEEQMQKMREEMKHKEFPGESGAGRVHVSVNGEKELNKVTINPECIDPNDVEGLQDLILEACKDAYKKVDAEGNSSGGLPLGGALPFDGF